MRRKCYFLVFRVNNGYRCGLNPPEPTGGIVMEPACIVDGKPVADFARAYDLAEDRYHTGKHETLLIEEVTCRKSCKLAKRLHDRWEREALEFRELMKVSE